MYNSLRKYVLLLITLILLMLPASVAAQNGCDHRIGLSEARADGRGNYSAVGAGDTVCIEAGNRERLVLENFRGTAAAPITFINDGGRVVIETDGFGGILVENSQHFRLTGTGSSDRYGIFIKRARNAGVRLRRLSEQFTVDHIEVANVDGSGIASQTQATCPGDPHHPINRDTFTQHNSVFHSNFVHDIATEGMYIGSSFYRGKQLSCGMVLPPALKGVDLYNNIVERAGWNSYQIGSAEADCALHHNTSRVDSLDQTRAQDGTIIIGSPNCRIYNNFMKDSLGPGIKLLGRGQFQVYNNVIVNMGLDAGLGDPMGAGIIAFNGQADIWHNTIINPRTNGIRFAQGQGSGHRVENNFIVASGDAPIHLGATASAAQNGNLHLDNIAAAGFADIAGDNFSPTQNSLAINAGSDLGGAAGTDFLGRSRPAGPAPDAGAYEGPTANGGVPAGGPGISPVTPSPGNGNGNGNNGNGNGRDFELPELPTPTDIITDIFAYVSELVINQIIAWVGSLVEPIIDWIALHWSLSGNGLLGTMLDIIFEFSFSILGAFFIIAITLIALNAVITTAFPFAFPFLTLGQMLARVLIISFVLAAGVRGWMTLSIDTVSIAALTMAIDGASVSSPAGAEWAWLPNLIVLVLNNPLAIEFFGIGILLVVVTALALAGALLLKQIAALLLIGTLPVAALCWLFKLTEGIWPKYWWMLIKVVALPIILAFFLRIILLIMTTVATSNFLVASLLIIVVQFVGMWVAFKFLTVGVGTLLSYPPVAKTVGAVTGLTLMVTGNAPAGAMVLANNTAPGATRAINALKPVKKVSDYEED